MCDFCEKKQKAPMEGTSGQGFRTLADQFALLFGGDKDTGSGVQLMEEDENFYISFDNSAGEYVCGVVGVNYCPMCGRSLKGE